MRKSRLTLAFLAMMLLGAATAFAQNITVKGTVTDGANGEPVPFASIVVKGTTVGIATDVDGNYSISAPKNGTLVFSSIGYVSQEIAIEGKGTINVTLAPDSQMLDETIVVAFGTVSKKDFTGSAAVVDSKKIESRPITNATNALEGATAGVQFTSASGQPGSSGSIRIRGFGSINADSSPLYVVDGTPYDGISNINPDDIESITVLKDAASSALYGARAANGVVLVTTKKGRSERVTFDVKVNQGFSVRGVPEYDRLDAYQYVPIAWEALRNSYLSAAASTYTMATASAKASADLIPVELMNNPFNVADAELVGVDGKLNPSAQLLYADDLDWTDAVSRIGHRQEYSISASGAGAKSDYYMSLGYLNEQGYTIKSYLERFNARMNMNIQPRKWFKVGLNLSGTMSNSDVTNTDSSTGYVNPFYFARNIGPIYPIHQHNADGSYVLDDNGEKVYEWANRGAGASLGRHIVAETLWNDHLYKRNVMNSRAYLDLYLMDGLKFTINAAYDFRNYLNHTNENPQVGDGSPAGRGMIVNYRYDTYNINQLLNYTKSIDSHNMDFLLGHESYDNNYKYVYGFKQGLIAEGNTELINYTTINSMYTYSMRAATEGYFARANYNYAHKYYLSASVRRDGTSKFYKDARWGTFWSIGGSWRMDEEPFIAEIPWIDSMKLRASYGTVGNDGTDTWFAWQSLYSIKKNANTPGFIQDTQAGNLALQWEVNRSFDLALEFGMLDNRLTGQVELFHRISDNLLFEVPLPLSSGVTSQWQNIGTMYNQGVELQLNADVVRTRDFKWNIGLNASHVKNCITKLPQNEITSGTKRYTVGHSMYDFWLYEYAGVDPTNGDALFYVGGYVEEPKLDENNDPILDTNGDPVMQLKKDENGLPIFDPTLDRETTNDYTKADKYYVGSSIPKVYGSISNNLSYKNFSLSVLMTYQVGGLKYDSTYGSLMSVGSLGSSLHTDILKSWHEEGDITDIPRIDKGMSNYLNPGSSRWLTDASYLNIRNITLTYNLPKRYVQKLDLSNVRIYGSVENAHLFCARKGMDPQYNFAGTSYNSYSPARTMSVGINIQF